MKARASWPGLPIFEQEAFSALQKRTQAMESAFAQFAVPGTPLPGGQVQFAGVGGIFQKDLLHLLGDGGIKDFDIDLKVSKQAQAIHISRTDSGPDAVDC